MISRLQLVENAQKPIAEDFKSYHSFVGGEGEITAIWTDFIMQLRRVPYFNFKF
jgi:hypothetical protein